jgi:DNA-binding response OmpR family regulator
MTWTLPMDRDFILKHLHLLLVDDNLDNNAALYSLASSLFKEVSLVRDAETALEILAMRNIDLIITDIRLPGMDGLDLVKHIRSNDTMIPLIVLSAHTDKEYLIRAANLQVDGYITKPLNTAKLDEALERSVRRLQHYVCPVRINSTITYHPLQKTLEVDEQQVSLGGKECKLLDLLILNRNKVVNKKQIHEVIWPDEIVSESALKNLLGELRKKLRYNVIMNRHGLGWTLASESE